MPHSTVWAGIQDAAVQAIRSQAPAHTILVTRVGFSSVSALLTMPLSLDL